MNKKAMTISFQSLIWIVRIIFIIIMSLSVVILVNSYSKTDIDIFEAEADIFFQNILFSLKSICGSGEENIRLFPLVLDINKIQDKDFESKLENIISYGLKNKHIGAKILFRIPEKEEIISYYNKDFYKEKKVLAELKHISGPGAARGLNREISILIKDGEKITNSFLIVDIVISNS